MDSKPCLEKGNPTGQIEFARMLLEFGSVVDATDIEGLAALWWACKCCTALYDENRSLFPSDQHPNALPPCAPFIRLLLNHGAVVDLPPESGSVPSPKAIGLQKLLDNSVIVVSDDSDEAPAVSGHAAKRVRPVAVKCLSSQYMYMYMYIYIYIYIYCAGNAILHRKQQTKLEVF